MVQAENVNVWLEIKEGEEGQWRGEIAKAIGEIKATEIKGRTRRDELNHCFYLRR